MSTKQRFHVFFDEGVQDGVVRNVETLQKFYKIFRVLVVEVIKVDGLDLDGVRIFVFAGEHLDFPVAAPKQVVVIVCVIYIHI